jgi:hypothetical protein
MALDERGSRHKKRPGKHTVCSTSFAAFLSSGCMSRLDSDLSQHLEIAVGQVIPGEMRDGRGNSGRIPRSFERARQRRGESFGVGRHRNAVRPSAAPNASIEVATPAPARKASRPFGKPSMTGPSGRQPTIRASVCGNAPRNGTRCSDPPGAGRRAPPWAGTDRQPRRWRAGLREGPSTREARRRPFTERVGERSHHLPRRRKMKRRRTSNRLRGKKHCRS